MYRITLLVALVSMILGALTAPASADHLRGPSFDLEIEAEHETFASEGRVEGTTSFYKEGPPRGRLEFDGFGDGIPNFANADIDTYGRDDKYRASVYVAGYTTPPFELPSFEREVDARQEIWDGNRLSIDGAVEYWAKDNTFTVDAWGYITEGAVVEVDSSYSTWSRKGRDYFSWRGSAIIDPIADSVPVTNAVAKGDALVFDTAAASVPLPGAFSGGVALVGLIGITRRPRRQRR